MSLNDIFNGGFDVESNYEEEKSGFQLLPKIDNAVVGVTSSEIIDNNNGWQGIKFGLQVMTDGEWGGQYIGKETNHVITIANTNHADSANWGRAELARWAKAVGIVSLNHESEFVGKQLSVNIDQRVNKKRTTEEKQMNPNAEPVMDQTFRSPQAIGGTAPMQQMTQPAPQQQYQQPAPQQAPQAFPQSAPNPFAK